MSSSSLCRGGRTTIKRDQAEHLAVPHVAALDSVRVGSQVSLRFPTSSVGAQLCEALRLGSLKLQLLRSGGTAEYASHTLWEDGCLASPLLLVFTSKSAFQRPQGALRL